MRTIVDEKAKNSKNNNVEIWKVPDIIALCKKEKVTVCRECGSINCAMWEKKDIKDKNEKLHLGECQGIAATFGNNAKFGIHFTPKFLHKKRDPKATIPQLQQILQLRKPLSMTQSLIMI